MLTPHGGGNPVSMKRTSAAGGVRRASDESTAKIEKQDLWDELQKRVASNEPFAPVDIAQAISAPEAAVAKALLTLSFERLLDKADANRYKAAPLANVSQADFVKALSARIDPKRQQDLLEIERLKKNNEEMRRRLLDAVAERDRYRALLEKAGIDPDATS
jgi:hypothetical protein